MRFLVFFLAALAFLALVASPALATAFLTSLWLLLALAGAGALLLPRRRSRA